MKWFDWNGDGSPPVDIDTKVVVLFSGDILTKEEAEKTKAMPAVAFRWNHIGVCDIIAYGVEEGD